MCCSSVDGVVTQVQKLRFAKHILAHSSFIYAMYMSRDDKMYYDSSYSTDLMILGPQKEAGLKNSFYLNTYSIHICNIIKKKLRKIR